MGAPSLMTEAAVPMHLPYPPTKFSQFKECYNTQLSRDDVALPNSSFPDQLHMKERQTKQNNGCALLRLDDARVLPPSSFEDFNHLLNDLSRVISDECTLGSHAYMQNYGLESFPSHSFACMENFPSDGNTLVSMLVEAGSIDDARSVFNRLSYRRDSSWKALIKGYINVGEPRKALLLYQEMRQDGSAQPSKHTFVAVLKACAQLKDLESACGVHRDIAKLGCLEEEIFVGSTLVDVYAKCGSLAKAQQVFDKLPVRNRVSWNALLTGYAKHGDSKRAIECFEQMQAEGISPDSVMLVCYLKACGSARALSKGHEIHTEILNHGLLETDVAIGNALMDMYAKCDCLPKAQEVFDKMPVQDVVSWTTLIAGYVECGDGAGALRYFKAMQNEGISADAVTFAASLKACGILASSVRGKEAHIQIVRVGLDMDLHVASALVDMYASCGMLETAKEVLSKCSARDVVLWNTLITGLCKQGQHVEALICFDQMQEEGGPPDAVTFVLSLTASSSLGEVAKGEEILAQLTKFGFLEKNTAVNNAVVEMFSKFGMFAEACKVFDGLSVREVVSWTGLIAGYTDNGFTEYALDCFKQMLIEGVPPNAHTFVCCLKACGSMQAIDTGQNLHAKIAETHLLEEDAAVGNALVDMYMKCRLLEEAKDVFFDLPFQDIVSYNALIGGYVQNEGSHKALLCLTQMQREGVSADLITYIWSLKACGNLQAIGKGLQLHIEIELRGLLERDPRIGNALLDMYSKCGSLAEAHDVFEMLPSRDVFTWNALIQGFFDHECFESALQCFEEMQHVRPDAVTFLYCLRACASLGAVEKGERLHAESVKLGLLESDNMVGCTLVEMYAECGLLENANRMFNNLSSRSLIAWTALMAGYTENKHGELALECLDLMLEDGFFPDNVTFLCCLKACGSVAILSKGQEIHAEIAKVGEPNRDLDISNALIDMYGKCGLPEKAAVVFDRLEAPDIFSWTALIAGYAVMGQIHSVFCLFKDMVGKNESPNVVTFTCILNACSHAGLIDTGKMFFKAMIREYGIHPTMEHLVCILDLLGRAGQLDKAVALIERMSTLPSPVVWQTLLGACSKSGGIELARKFFRNAMSLDKKDSAAYVSMSNIYVECG